MSLQEIREWCSIPRYRQSPLVASRLSVRILIAMLALVTLLHDRKKLSSDPELESLTVALEW